MNSENSWTSHHHRLILNVTDKMNLKRDDKYVALSNLSICYALKNVKKLCKNNKFKISAPTWNDKFELPDGSYSVLDIHDYLEYIIKKHVNVSDILPIRIYVNKIENRITFTIVIILSQEN